MTTTAKRPRRSGKPHGRASSIEDVAATGPDGQPITAGQQVVERVRAVWSDFETAAGSAGVSRATVHNWRRRGARARAKAAGIAAKIAAGIELDPKVDVLDEREAAYARFVDELERAEDEAELRYVNLIDEAARGGREITETREKWGHVMIDGKAELVLLERAVTTKTARPEWTAAAWRLERRKPFKYARRVELTGAEGGPISVQSEQEVVAKLLAGDPEAAIAADTLHSKALAAGLSIVEGEKAS